MNNAALAFVCLISCTLSFVPAIAQCEANIAVRSPRHGAVVAPGWDAEAHAARTAARKIYDHGLLGNSDSAIDNKVGRPPGVSIAVAVEGRIVWAEGFGMADLEECVPVTPRTKFRIGSTSKPITSAGAMLLHEEGRLDLDAPIQRYVPSFPEKRYVITTRELLGHLGGIRGYTDADGDIENTKHYDSVTQSLERFKNDPLAAPPETKWLYSTYGYTLISAAIEGASGQEFLSFMRDRVFLPLQMRDTLADEDSDVIPNRARWYNVRADGTYRNSPYADLSYKWAGGGFLSTAEDLVRFGSAMLRPGFLKQDTLTQTFTPQKTTAGVETKYGLGWEIYPKGPGEMRRFEHSGGATGSSSLLILYPDQGVVIAWLQNSDDFRDPPLSRIAAPFLAASQKRIPRQALTIRAR